MCISIGSTVEIALGCTGEVALWTVRASGLKTNRPVSNQRISVRQRGRLAQKAASPRVRRAYRRAPFYVYSSYRAP